MSIQRKALVPSSKKAWRNSSWKLTQKTQTSPATFLVRTINKILEDMNSDKQPFNNLLTYFRHSLDLVEAADDKNIGEY